MEKLPDGFVVFCKRECATCAMVVPVMKELRKGNQMLTIYTQDDPAFPEGIPAVIDDRFLERSYHLHIETVPTLIRVEKGEEVARTVGWDRAEWRALTGMEGLGDGLPDFRPGCGLVQAENGSRMLHFDESVGRLRSYPLRRRIGRNAVRMFRLQIAKLVHPSIVFRITDRRVGQHIVAVVMVVDLAPELLDA